MLRYLLDEHISPAVAEGVAGKRPGIRIASLHRWKNGKLVGGTDREVLVEASSRHLTLVTYDCRTIPPLLSELAQDGISHAGVLFVDELTIASNNFGALIAALADFWTTHKSLNWRNRISYLTKRC